MNNEEDKLRQAFVQVLTKSYTLIEKRDLYFLVQVALLNEEITVSKASELLGIPLEDMRSIMAGWLKEPEKYDVVVPGKEDG